MIFTLHYEVYGSLSVSAVIAVLYGPVPALLTAATLIEYSVDEDSPAIVVSVLVPPDTGIVCVLPLPTSPYRTE